MLEMWVQIIIKKTLIVSTIHFVQNGRQFCRSVFTDIVQIISDPLSKLHLETCEVRVLKLF